MIKKESILVILSLSCSIHCILTPILIGLSPFLGKFLQIHELEIALIALSILCGIYIMYSGYYKHRKNKGICLFCLGALIWISSFFIDSIFSLDAELILIILGSCFVITSYILNHNFLKVLKSN